MNQVASPMQLRMSMLRWGLFFVPLVVLLGFASGRLVGSGDSNPWFAMLTKPEAQPPGWVFPIAWATLYVLLGLAITIIFCARGARLRPIAMLLFAVQLLLNLFWPIYFFGMHQVSGGFLLLVALFAAAVATTLVFGRVRKLAAWLMVPYLAWLCFAAILNKQIDELNPDAESLVPKQGQTISIPLAS